MKPGRAARLALSALAVVCAGLAITIWAAPGAGAQGDGTLQGAAPNRPTDRAAQVRDGRALYLQACSSCHGEDARGNADLGPTLVGVGARSADFYLETGRMPLDHPNDEPVRQPPAYSKEARRALVAYIASLGGPPVPRVDVAQGKIGEGKELFTSNCSGCHQVAAQGGIVPPDGIAPALQSASAQQVAQAIRIGPYTMPRFSPEQLSDAEIASLARYVAYTRDPDDPGGWGIGHIGPVPEGMVAWLLAGVALLIIVRLLGRRTP